MLKNTIVRLQLLDPNDRKHKRGKNECDIDTICVVISRFFTLQSGYSHFWRIGFYVCSTLRLRCAECEPGIGAKCTSSASGPVHCSPNVNGPMGIGRAFKYFGFKICFIVML